MLFTRSDSINSGGKEMERKGDNFIKRRSTFPAFLRRMTTKKEPIYKQSPDYYLKLVLLGDVAAGKTSLAKVFSCNTCRSSFLRKPSYNAENKMVEFVDRLISVSEKLVLTRLYDTAGQEKFRSLTASYYRGAHGCLVLFDVTKETTFDNLTYWLHDLKEYSTYPEISTILVGTKCHVPPEQRQVSFERAQKYADSVGLPYMEVSAEEGKNVTEVFEKLADIIIEKITAGQTPIISPPIKLVHEKAKRKQPFCSC